MQPSLKYFLKEREIYVTHIDESNDSQLSKYAGKFQVDGRGRLEARFGENFDVARLKITEKKELAILGIEQIIHKFKCCPKGKAPFYKYTDSQVTCINSARFVDFEQYYSKDDFKKHGDFLERYLGEII